MINIFKKYFIFNSIQLKTNNQCKKKHFRAADPDADAPLSTPLCIDDLHTVDYDRFFYQFGHKRASVPRRRRRRTQRIV